MLAASLCRAARASALVAAMSTISLDGLIMLRFSATLEAAIKDVLPSTDPLDEPNHPTAYINKLLGEDSQLEWMPRKSCRSR